MFVAALVTALVAVAIMVAGIQKVDEGYVGISYFGGAVVDKLFHPGYHIQTPLLTEFFSLPVTIQTTQIDNVPCGTSSGIVIEYERVEVVYQLNRALLLDTVRNYSTHFVKLWIHDLVRHSINEICSVNTMQEIYIEKFSMLDDLLVKSLKKTHAVWAPGLNVITARTTKPTIPEVIRVNYEAIEDQRTQLLVKDQAQKRILKKEETTGLMKISAAEKEASIMKLTSAQRVAERKAQAEIATIDIEMSLDRRKAQVDAKYERDLQRAEANARRLTPQFLKLQRTLAELKDTKMYLGPHVPTHIVEGQSTGLELNQLVN